MSARFTVLAWVVAFFIVHAVLVGCSQEDTDEQPKSQKVVVRIKRTPPKEPGTIDVRKNSELGPIVEIAKDEETQKPGTTGKNTPIGAKEEKNAPRKGHAQSKITEQGGWYETQGSDTLALVAGSPRVYSDPYKWPSLLRLNLDKLEPFGLTRGLELRKLPQGLRLRYLTPKEVEENRKKLNGCRWVVSILSDRNSDELSPLAVDLIKNGLSVYIARAEIKGEQWLRLRTGFFPSLDEAKRIRAKVEEITGLKGLWLAKISDKEFDEYAGY
ncbi:MAG: SPOR domain-containing protein [Deltaproteobacteria bacterium]|nr:SPOR domain-containing protein [Deltaproteobacteria bacterium]MBW2083932.1 SPOR domain-containing protein [Deltaproteobacteria bacterium]HDM10552.1 SPOR domain-containing protein [Desulfobacteraceae bacterium]